MASIRPALRARGGRYYCWLRSNDPVSARIAHTDIERSAALAAMDADACAAHVLAREGLRHRFAQPLPVRFAAAGLASLTLGVDGADLYQSCGAHQQAKAIGAVDIAVEHARGLAAYSEPWGRCPSAPKSEVSSR
jgi:hypothetical protein